MRQVVFSDEIEGEVGEIAVLNIVRRPPKSQLQLEIGDADMWDEVERSWRAMIRVCLILYSVLTKNMSRLKNPDGQKSLTAYH